MYYSVLIMYDEQKGRNKPVTKSAVLIDKENLDEISDVVIKPYLQGINFIVDGFILNKSKITRLKIVESPKSIKDLRDYKQSRLSPGIIHSYSYGEIIDDDDLVKGNLYKPCFPQRLAHIR